VVDATKSIAAHGKLMAERAATPMQGEVPAWTTSQPADYHYLDSAKRPRGPVSRSELDLLFQSGAITSDTDILLTGAQGWTTYGSLLPTTVDT